MDEGAMQREIWAFYFPTRVVEWVGKLPAKMERDCSRALSENIWKQKRTALRCLWFSYSGSPRPGSVICQMGGIATFLSPRKFSSLPRRRTENRGKGVGNIIAKGLPFVDIPSRKSSI